MLDSILKSPSGATVKASAGELSLLGLPWMASGAMARIYESEVAAAGGNHIIKHLFERV